MDEQILSLLRSIPEDHPLGAVVRSILSPELQHAVQIKISYLTSDFKHFSRIYRRRYHHLSKRKIENHGFLESISNMAAHPGQKRAASIHTRKFNVIAWTDPDIKQLLGLVLVAKVRDDTASQTTTTD